VGVRLLRPARLLDPFIEPGTPFVDHSCVEVLLVGCWIATDSYIAGAPLHRAASRHLQETGRSLGFGIHRDGTSTWDGRSDSFCQFVRSPGAASTTTRDYGIHEDVGAVYAAGNGVNRLNVFLQLGFGFFARAANRCVEAPRAEGSV
jgi:hypothetical protein